MTFVFIVLAIFVLLIIFFGKSNNNQLENDLHEQYYSKLGKELLYKFENIKFYTNQDKTRFEIILSNNNLISIDTCSLRKVELYEDNTCAMSVGRAVVGGALFGTAGAIVGGSSGKNKIDNLTMVIYTKNLRQPQITVPLITNRTSKESSIYIRAIQFARNVMGALEIVIEENKEN